MPTAFINGRLVELPATTTDQEIREVGQIAPGRNVIHRTREGNYLVPRDTTVEILDGDRFGDAPARVKGEGRRR